MLDTVHGPSRPIGHKWDVQQISAGNLVNRGHTLVPREIVKCIEHDRNPTDLELSRVADHIWSDVCDSKGRLRRNLGNDRLLCWKAAHAALTGASTPHY